jgi:HEAT repeat protein
MRRLTLALLVLGALEAVAAGGEAREKRIQEWLARLRTDPVVRRRRLIEEIRAEGTIGLGGHPPKGSSKRTDLLPVLEAALANEDEQVRSEAVLTLAYMKCPDALPVLERALASPHRTVRYYACMGVEWLADFAALRSSCVAALEKARDRKEEDDRNVELHAAAALHGLGVKQEPALFLEALRDPKANEALAAGILADLGRKEAVELIVTRLRTAVPDGDHYLAEALAKLTGASCGKDADAWQKWLDAHRSELPEQAR